MGSETLDRIAQWQLYAPSKKIRIRLRSEKDGWCHFYIPLTIQMICHVKIPEELQFPDITCHAASLPRMALFVSSLVFGKQLQLLASFNLVASRGIHIMQIKATYIGSFQVSFRLVLRLCPIPNCEDSPATRTSSRFAAVCSFSGSAVKEIRLAESRWAMDTMTGYEPKIRMIIPVVWK